MKIIIFKIIVVILVIFALIGTVNIIDAMYFDDDKWCKLVKPMMNDSSNEKVSHCFGEGWKEYCKESYPSYCEVEQNE